MSRRCIDTGANRQGAAIGHGIAGIEAEVHHDLLELILISARHRQLRGERRFHVDPGRHDALGQFQGLDNNRVEIDGLDLARSLLAERQ
jgi:hypothetical protein